MDQGHFIYLWSEHKGTQCYHIAAIEGIRKERWPSRTLCYSGFRGRPGIGSADTLDAIPDHLRLCSECARYVNRGEMKK